MLVADRAGARSTCRAGRPAACSRAGTGRIGCGRRRSCATSVRDIRRHVVCRSNCRRCTASAATSPLGSSRGSPALCLSSPMNCSSVGSCVPHHRQERRAATARASMHDAVGADADVGLAAIGSSGERTESSTSSSSRSASMHGFARGIAQCPPRPRCARRRRRSRGRASSDADAALQAADRSSAASRTSPPCSCTTAPSGRRAAAPPSASRSRARAHVSEHAGRVRSSRAS